VTVAINSTTNIAIHIHVIINDRGLPSKVWLSTVTQPFSSKLWLLFCYMVWWSRFSWATREANMVWSMLCQLHQREFYRQSNRCYWRPR